MSQEKTVLVTNKIRVDFIDEIKCASWTMGQEKCPHLETRLRSFTKGAEYACALFDVDPLQTQGEEIARWDEEQRFRPKRCNACIEAEKAVNERGEIPEELTG